MKLLLGPMLRHVTETTATVWVETDEACEVTILHACAPTFSAYGHHYALVVITGLEPGSTTVYEVRLDGERHWPLPHESSAGPDLPDSVIRTHHAGMTQRLMFGSCRSAAPHEPPYSLELDHDDRGRGIDALWAYGRRMRHQPPDEWPTLLVFLGDQVYADDSSPQARERIEQRRPDDGLPPEIVANFEEYTWLYREAWAPPLERWMMSVVPSVMIFDDHDMIDDWNISDSWVEMIRQQPWWSKHIIGGLSSYWIYQHLGNLSPAQLEHEGMLAEVQELGDATAYLEQWALESESFTPVPGGYQFSYVRELGDVRLVMIDVRNGRLLERGKRRIVDDGEWNWIRESCLAPCQHLLLGSSLPVFVPGGLHGIQRWNEALCNRAPRSVRSRIGERMRQSIDLEDWSAFAASFDSMIDLLAATATATATRDAPDTITVLSGDIHFAYVADVHLGATKAGPAPAGAALMGTAPLRSAIRQVVSSPIRNALVARERRVIRFASSRVGRWIGQRLVRRLPSTATHTAEWDMVHGPYFANNIGVLTFTPATNSPPGSAEMTAHLALLGADTGGDEQRDPITLARVALNSGHSG